MPERLPNLEQHVIARLVSVPGVDPQELQIELSKADRERAARYRFDEDRTRFLLGRVLLARMLQRYTDKNCRVANLTYTAQGRPVFADEPSLHFSISHAGDLVTVALASETLVGIDVECMARDVQLDALAERIFSDDDLRRFRALPGKESRAAFFHAWTGKEAVLKARGVGLAGGLKEVSIYARGDKPSVRLTGDATSRGEIWRLHPLPVPANYLGHLAWNDAGKTVDFREVRWGDLF